MVVIALKWPTAMDIWWSFDGYLLLDFINWLLFLFGWYLIACNRKPEAIAMTCHDLMCRPFITFQFSLSSFCFFCFFLWGRRRGGEEGGGDWEPRRMELIWSLVIYVSFICNKCLVICLFLVARWAFFNGSLEFESTLKSTRADSCLLSWSWKFNLSLVDENSTKVGCLVAGKASLKADFEVDLKPKVDNQQVDYKADFKVWVKLEWTWK